MKYFAEIHILDNDTEIVYGITKVKHDNEYIDILFAQTGYKSEKNNIFTAIDNIISMAGGFDNIKSFKLYINNKYFELIQGLIDKSDKYSIADITRLHTLYPIGNITIKEKSESEDNFAKFIKDLPIDEFCHLTSELTKQGKSLKDLEKAYNALDKISKFTIDSVKKSIEFLK